MFLLVKCMPDRLREKIAEVIEAAYPSDWNYMAVGEVERRGFQVDHFCLWNRYCGNVRHFMVSITFMTYHFFQGIDAPKYVHPSNIMGLCQDTSCPRCHRIPHLSQAIVEDGGYLYKQLTTGLGDVFSWLEDKVSVHSSTFSTFLIFLTR